MSMFVANSIQFFLEVIKFFPPILILMSLLDVWVPNEKLQQSLGGKSGAKGNFLAVMLGTVAAGPLFAAYPIAKSLSDKGVRRANVVIFLGAWATIKIPMLLMESSYLGIKFTVIRFFITLPFIIVSGYIIEKVLDF